MRMTGRMLLLATVFILFPLSAHGQGQQFTVGVEAIDYYPLYAGDGGEYRGYARDLLDAFAKKQGYVFKYEPLPIKRLFQAFLTEQALDFKFPDNPYWSQDMRQGLEVRYSEPAVQYIDGVMVLPERKGGGPEGLKVLGIIGGFTAFEYLEQIKSGAMTVDESTEYSAMLQKAIMGRVDAAYSSVAVANYQLRDVLKQPEALVLDASLPHTKSGYQLSTIRHPQIIEEFNQFLKDEAALVQQLKDKYQAEAGVQ
ncbi:substrate-binding periplasmic protein [Megalodesulfovibrio paquesii]